MERVVRTLLNDPDTVTSTTSGGSVTASSAAVDSSSTPQFPPPPRQQQRQTVSSVAPAQRPSSATAESRQASSPDVDVPLQKATATLPRESTRETSPAAVANSGGAELSAAADGHKLDLTISERGRQRAVDNPRFKLKSSSSSAKPNADKSEGSDGKPPATSCVTSESVVDVLQFQSPLAAADNTRAASTTGYNRPPNRRYQQLLERGGITEQQQSVRVDSRYASDPRRQQNFDGRQPISLLEAVVTYPATGVLAEDGLASACDDGLANGSLKDMFKTIDPTASPFC